MNSERCSELTDTIYELQMKLAEKFKRSHAVAMPERCLVTVKSRSDKRCRFVSMKHTDIDDFMTEIKLNLLMSGISENETVSFREVEYSASTNTAIWELPLSDWNLAEYGVCFWNDGAWRFQGIEMKFLDEED